MAKRKSFRAPAHQDFTIVEDNKVIGHLRVKPNAIAWKTKSTQKFDQVTLDQFAAFAAEKGRQVEK